MTNKRQRIKTIEVARRTMERANMAMPAENPEYQPTVFVTAEQALRQVQAFVEFVGKQELVGVNARRVVGLRIEKLAKECGFQLEDAQPNSSRAYEKRETAGMSFVGFLLFPHANDEKVWEVRFYLNPQTKCIFADIMNPSPKNPTR